MSKISLKRIGDWMLRYKFTILAFVSFFLISFKIIEFGFNKPVFISALALGFLLHLFSRTRFSIVFVILFSLILTVNAYFGFVLDTPMTMGLLGSMLDTNADEFTNMSGQVLPVGLLILALIFAK